MQYLGSQFGYDQSVDISCFGSDHLYRRMWCAMQFDSVMASETMDTSSDNLDSRKRPLEIETAENGVAKKSHYVADSETGTYHMKLLVPSVAAGAIIGKGGETIAQLQRDKHAKVKMSKANDYYPGTTERVCIISSSSPDSIMDVLTFIMEKIKEKPDVTKPVVTESSTEREKQVKILVPNTTAGMIIGKGGSFIKQIKEQTGAYIQLSQKPKDVSLPERCITISGDMETNTKVCQMILQKIMEDPQSGSCLNLSYADVTGPVANFNPTGSPYAMKPALTNGVFAGGGSDGVLNGGLNLCLSMPSVNNNYDTNLTSKLVEHVNLVLRSSGFSEQCTAEIAAALSILAKYGMLGMGYGLTNGAAPKAPSPPSAISNAMSTGLELAALQQQSNAMAAAGASLFGPVGSAIASRAFDIPSPAAPTFDIFHPSHLTINNNCLTLAPGGAADLLTADLTAAAQDIKKVDIEVTEEAATAILGPAGRSLLEIQLRTGAYIQLSKKCYYNANGVAGRVLTISGTSTAVAAAQYFIEHQISEADVKRLRNGLTITE